MLAEGMGCHSSTGGVGEGEKGPVGIVARLPGPWQGWEPAFLPPAQCTGECRTLVFFIINNNC